MEICKCINEREFICNNIELYPNKCIDYVDNSSIVSMIYFFSIILSIGYLFLCYYKDYFEIRDDKVCLMNFIILLPIPCISYGIYLYISYNNIGYDLISNSQKIVQLIFPIIMLIICLIIIIFRTKLLKPENQLNDLLLLSLLVVTGYVLTNLIEYHYNYENTFNECCINQKILNEKKVYILLLYSVII